MTVVDSNEVHERTPEHAQLSQLPVDKRFRAGYHRIVDHKGWPLANLIILFDRYQRRPARAELHVDVEAPESAEDYAIREAQQILNAEYSTEETGAGKLELRLLRVEQQREPLHLDIPVVESSDRQSLWSPTLLLAVAAIGMIVVGLVWGIMTLLQRETPAETDAATLGSEEQTAQKQASEDEREEAPLSQQLSAVAGGVDPNLPQTNGLPTSQRADPSLTVGQRVQVVSGAALTLRTQPGATAGEAVGYMQDGQQATIVGGPYWAQGISDTVVWWFLRLDGGEEYWAPANDSQFKLLEAVP